MKKTSDSDHSSVILFEILIGLRFDQKIHCLDSHINRSNHHCRKETMQKKQYVIYTAYICTSTFKRSKSKNTSQHKLIPNISRSNPQHNFAYKLFIFNHFCHSKTITESSNLDSTYGTLPKNFHRKWREAGPPKGKSCVSTATNSWGYVTSTLLGYWRLAVS